MAYFNVRFFWFLDLLDFFWFISKKEVSSAQKRYSDKNSPLGVNNDELRTTMGIEAEIPKTPREKDCLSCKAIGCSMFLGLSAYMLKVRSDLPKTSRNHRMFLAGTAGAALAASVARALV
jgi:hypothetical protein